ncbi:MAG TPA: peptidoglycan DD-metalloendopeptidase family protein [Bacteroidales bacterium]|nr:peptidoglycan DD-metalloendopeptidase family protein [Bacteroidales bacterium]
MKRYLPHLALLAVAGIAVILLAILFHPVPETEPEPPAPDPVILYGLVSDSFEVSTGEVLDGDNLSVLLGRMGLAPDAVEQLVSRSATVFSPRAIRAGNPWCLFSRDSIPVYWVYEKDRVNYIVYSLTDSLYAWAGRKPVDTLWTRAGGSIEGSLWNSLIASGNNPELALTLSEIYAWTVDFYGIQKGDAYKVFYQRFMVDSTDIGIGEVPVAWFSHAGKEIFAFRFLQDSAVGYFDETGQSLRRSFLKAPLKFSRISSRFSHSRLHPVLKIRRPHHGVDYAAPIGTPVRSIGDGKVVRAGWSGGAGRMVKIRHNSTYTTAYLHLARFAEGIHDGARVRQGQIIGYVGSSGLSTGPHLDFRFYKNGHPIDPLQVESPPADPVRPADMERFRQVVDSLRPVMEGITL